MTDSKQRQIIEAVWQVIATQGLAQVSMRSVAAAAGVSVGRVQHHFGTKAELVRASVTEMLSAAEQGHPEASGQPGKPETLWSLLTHSLTPAHASRAGVSVFYAYVAASVTDPWIAEQLADAKRGQIRLVAACLPDLETNTATRERTAEQLVALADGCTQAVYLGHLSPELAAAHIRQAIDGLPGRD
ncbi:TetR/AcrR family transcriptional regulator [Luteococcus sp. Sow4_B9]|uniref:TetR/AcrR family transcriptional regulator n=1 Tax=Luteococcus sp. Sow4_B9 TaxID=3438792 RepID=UPI003F986742